MNEQDLSGNVPPSPAAVAAGLSQRMLLKVRNLSHERMKLTRDFAGGVVFGELPSIRQGDGKFFAATPPASGRRIRIPDRWPDLVENFVLFPPASVETLSRQEQFRSEQN